MSRPIRSVAHPRLLKRFGILVFFTNFGLMEFQVRYLVFFFFFFFPEVDLYLDKSTIRPWMDY